MDNKKYIFSPISGNIKKIFEKKKNKIYKKKITICSQGNIIVAPCNGIIYNCQLEKMSFIMQLDSNITITIKNKYKKKNKVYQMIKNKKNQKICAGTIIFTIKNSNIKKNIINLDTLIKIYSNKKMKKKKNFLYYVRAGISILAVI
ncbi:hypothetical protein [Buchnera aphidicola]|uniref:PTS system glucose-specific EIIA component n=1 Tax=Buchnera aphidicola (Cinara strobi) TaxID=1921549 RepID=A0A3B1DKK2_9GAMM|nr:hypothetical protein [Buchnera aphidicola]VAX76251.1 PTS system glucose-specific EIIA component [Buchnera aphidicola (Cinara strobi)]